MDEIRSRYNLSVNELKNIILAVDLLIEDRTIRSKQGSESYWNYIHKICECRG